MYEHIHHILNIQVSHTRPRYPLKGNAALPTPTSCMWMLRAALLTEATSERVSKALEWVGGRRTTQVVDDYWEITHQLLLSTTPMVRFTHPGKWNMSLQRLQPARSCLYSIVKELKLIVVASSWEMLGGVNYSGTKRILGGDRKVQEIRSCRISSVIQDYKPTYSFTLLLSNTHFKDKACLIQKLQSPYRFFHHSEC